MTTAETLGSVFPISITFAQGEQPSDGKFSGWASQTDAGLTLLAKSIGDIWGTEFEDNKLYVAVQRPPHIINLARFIGPASAINPVRPVGDSTRTEFDVVLDPATIPENVNEFNLRDDCDCEPPINWDATYPLGQIKVNNSIATVLEHISTDAGDSVFSNQETTLSGVNTAGDYYVDTNGNVFTYTRTGDYSAVVSDSDTTYQTTMAPDMYDQATLNVIPDMNQTTSEGLCDVLSTTEDAGISADEYIVRTPYIVKLPQRDANNSPLEPGDIGCPPVSFGDTTDGERALLPYVLKATTGMNLNDGDQIPDGFIGLWDETNNVMITGLTFYLSDATAVTDTDGFSSDYCVVVTGATLTTNAVFPAKGTKYRLVTVGTTITESLAALNRRYDIHDHNDRAGGFPISHLNTINKHIAPSIVSTIWSTEVDSPPSEITGNDHPQYLSRYGWTGVDGDPGQYDNAMLGHIFMGKDTADYITNGYYGGTNSQRIYFNADTTYIYASSTNLRLDGMNLHVGYGETDAAIYFAATDSARALKYDGSESTFYFTTGLLGCRGSTVQAGKLLVHARAPHEDPSSLTNSSPVVEISTNTTGDEYARISLRGYNFLYPLIFTGTQSGDNTIESSKGLTISTTNSADLTLDPAGDVVVSLASDSKYLSVVNDANDSNLALGFVNTEDPTISFMDGAVEKSSIYCNMTSILNYLRYYLHLYSTGGIYLNSADYANPTRVSYGPVIETGVDPWNTHGNGILVDADKFKSGYMLWNSSTKELWIMNMNGVHRFWYKVGFAPA